MYEQYTDKQIVEMLRPKLTKIMDGMNGMLDTALEHSEGGRNLIKLIATIYRSAYIRGQLGRSFIIGEKKEKDSVVAFQVGDKVKLITKNGIDENNPCFPPIGTIGKVVELSSGYCFIRWPNGATYSNGALSCPYSFLEKATEYWASATKDNVKRGDKVRYLNAEKHEQNPEFYPLQGTIGEVVSVCEDNTCFVQWPNYKTAWFASQFDLEVLLYE